MVARLLLYVLLITWIVSPLPATAINSASPGSPNLPLPGVTLVEGKDASFLLGYPLSTFRVYSFHGDVPVPIPFQIDERDSRDRWVLDHRPRQNRDNVIGEFDANDEIVLMNRDLGRRGDFAQLPSGAKAWAEIQVGNEPRALGFAYIGLFDTPPPLSQEDFTYARYVSETDRVYTERYALAFGAPLPTHLAFVNQLGDLGTNLIAGVRAIGEVRFLQGLFTLRRTDEDIRTEIQSYRQGAVRAIRRARYWIPLPWGFHTAGRVDLLFYRDFVEGTAIVNLKLSPRLVLADGELRTYFRFLDLSGAHLLSEGIQLTDPVDGHMTPAKQALTGRPAQWAALLLPTGRSLLLIVRLDGSLRQLEQRLYFDDNTSPEKKDGGKPVFGFEFLRVNRLETGVHRLSVFAIILDSTTPEDIHQAVSLFLSPPQVTVSILKADAPH